MKPFAPSSLLGIGPPVKPSILKSRVPDPVRRGFQAMSKRRAREIQSKGGQAVAKDRAWMRRIGRKGGLV